MAMKWTKDGDGWVCRVPPDAIFTMKVQPKGDGRWTWEIFPQTGDRTIAGGIMSSMGAAKTVSENFANRSGKI
jgi:hypothetical protein